MQDVQGVGPQRHFKRDHWKGHALIGSSASFEKAVQENPALPLSDCRLQIQ